MTTAPGDTVFTAFGHSALRISGGGLAEPLVLDWGTYDPRQGNPLVLFVTGRMDYSLESVPSNHLMGRARVQDRTVVAQRLALPPDAIERLFTDVDAALQQDDRRFKYEPGLDNCSTRIRDALDRATQGAIRAQTRLPLQVTRRSEVLRHVGASERGASGWLWWGVFELALTEQSDDPIDAWDSMFIPQDLMRELRAVRLDWPDDSRRDLVADECVLRRGGHDFVADQPPTRGPVLATVGAAWALLVLTAASRKLRAVGSAAIAALAVVLGSVGTATTLLWAFGDLVGLGANETWWVASLLSWLLLATLGSGEAGRTRRRLLSAGLAALALIGLGRALLGLPDQEVLPVYAALVPPLVAAALVQLRR